MTEYSNILSALHNAKLTPQQQVENWDAFKKLQDAGITVPDLVKRLESLEDKVSKLSESKPVQDAELFAMMAETVKDDPAVVEAKKKMQTEKTRALSELCLKDAGYQSAYEKYRAVVTQAYMSKVPASPYGPIYEAPEPEEKLREKTRVPT